MDERIPCNSAVRSELLDQRGEAKRRPTRPWLLVCAGVGVLLISSVGWAQHAPPSGDRPWQPPTNIASAEGRKATKDQQTAIVPSHQYSLPELVDLAEQHNPTTRAAWQAARAQAGALRIAKSDLLPALAAVAMTNTTRDGVLFGDTFVRQTTGVYQPMLELNYLVLDFGGRGSQIEEARQQLLAADFEFNRALLDVLFETARLYYTLLNEAGQLDAANNNLNNAETVRKATEARLAVGLATLPDALEARAAAAQANFTVQDTIGRVDIARGDLLSLLGASPASSLNVQPLAGLSIPDKFEVNIDDALQRSIVQRPELGSQIATSEAARAEVRRARSSFLPQFVLQGEGGEFRSYGAQDQLPATYTGPKEQWNLTLNLRWEIFDGGRRQGQLEQARADEGRAQAQIKETRDDVENQVWNAYVSVRAAFYERQAADQLLQASQTSYEASLKSFQLGLRSTVDVVTAQRTLAQALSTDVSARTDLLTKLAYLAYRTGDLLEDASRKQHP